MYIRDFRVRNFLVHQDTRITPHPLTVLVGPNNGGKSALFDAMLNFSMLSRGNIVQAFGPYPFSFNATRYRGASAVARVGFSATVSVGQGDEQYLDYEIDYAQHGVTERGPSFLIFNERLTLQPESKVVFDRSNPDVYPIASALHLESDRSLLASIRSARTAGIELEVPRMITHFVEHVSRFNKFRLDPNVLGGTSRLPEIGSEPADASYAPRLGYLGEDLAATLYYLNATESPVLETIREKVRLLEPTFCDFEFSSVGADRIAFAVRYDDQRGTVTSVRLSSGFLVFIGLITLVSTPNRPSVLMIEEPENGLTPQAQKAFYQSLRALALNENPQDRSQVFISSHSPFVICEAWNGEDRSFIHQVKVVDGKGVIRPFSELVDEHHVPLGRDKYGERTHLSLKNAEDIMSGCFA